MNASLRFTLLHRAAALSTFSLRPKLLLSSSRSLRYIHFTRPTTATVAAMPPKRAAASKRKAEPASEDDEPLSAAESSQSEVEPAPKKRKTATKANGTAKKGQGKGKSAAKEATTRKGDEGADAAAASENAQPTNKVLPVQISFAPKAEGTVRIATWNICGLAAASKKVRGLRFVIWYH